MSNDGKQSVKADAALPARRKISPVEYLRKYNSIVTFLVMLIIATVATNGRFLTPSNALTVVERASIYGIVALGQCLVILTGAIDLSVSAVMNLSFTSIAVLSHGGMPYELAIPVALAIGAVVGLVNGLLVVKTKIPPWLVTLSTMLIVNALALRWSGTLGLRFDGLQNFINGIFGMNAETSRYFAGVVWVVCGLIFAFILARTRFGLNIYFLGGGRRAAYLSGVRVEFTQVTAYVLSGVMASAAAIVLAYRIGTLNPTSADPYQLYSIAAVVMGGTLITGGQGSAFGTFFGAIVLAMLTNVLNILMVNVYIQYTIMGVLLVLIVYINLFLSRRSR